MMPPKLFEIMFLRQISPKCTVFGQHRSLDIWHKVHTVCNSRNNIQTPIHIAGGGMYGGVLLDNLPLSVSRVVYLRIFKNTFYLYIL